MDLSSVFRTRTFNKEESKSSSTCSMPIKRQSINDQVYSYDHNQKKFVRDSNIDYLARYYEELQQLEESDGEGPPFLPSKINFGLGQEWETDNPRSESAKEIKKGLFEKWNKPNDNVLTYEDQQSLLNTYVISVDYLDRHNNVLRIEHKSPKEVGIVMNPHLNKLRHKVITLTVPEFLYRMNFQPAFVMENY